MIDYNDIPINNRLIYIVTRLYDYFEKIKAEETEEAVLRGLKQAFRRRNIITTHHNPLTFVPFRDTAQDKIEAPDKTKIIYEEDMKRLEKVFAIVGFLGGLAKDEGVCMEIGYAYGKGIPIIIISTDFIKRELKAKKDSTHVFDPILEIMATKIIRICDIPNLPIKFSGRLKAALRNVYKAISQEVYKLATDLSTRDVSIPLNEPNIDVYVDFGGGHFEWERVFQKQLANILASKGFSTMTSQRYAYYDENSEFIIPSMRELGRRDLENMVMAKVVVTCGDGDEMSSGTAAIHGFARALGKKIVLYDSRLTYLVGDGGHKMSRNLMIDYSADKIVRKIQDIEPAVSCLL